MSTLREIEAAAETLPAAQKQQLLLFLAEKLRVDRAALPAPRRFSREQVRGWIEEDEADARRFNDGR
jgi:hypothetical protein